MAFRVMLHSLGGFLFVYTFKEKWETPKFVFLCCSLMVKRDVILTFFFFYPSGLLFPFFAEEEGKYSHILLSVFLPLFELFGFTPFFFLFFKIHALFSHLFDDVLRLLWSEAYRFFFFYLSRTRRVY